MPPAPPKRKPGAGRPRIPVAERAQFYASTLPPAVAAQIRRVFAVDRLGTGTRMALLEWSAARTAAEGHL